MGRISTPIMNKSGYTMYWNSMWDDKINYNRALKEDIFLKEFVYLLFEGGSSFMFFLNLKNFTNDFKYLNKKYLFHVKKIFKKNDIGNEIGYKYVVKRNKKFRPYISKVWVLRYQNWVIVYFYVYSFNLSTFYIKNIKLKNMKKYFSLVNNYYHNTIKIRYNYLFYKNSFFFKNF